MFWNQWKRTVSMLLVFVMVFSMMPIQVFAEGTDSLVVEHDHDHEVVTSTETPVEPTEAPADPTEAPVEPTEAPAEPTEAPADPTEVPVEPTEAPVEPTEAPAEPTEAPVEPTEAPAEPTEAPADPTEVPVEPTEAPAEPTEVPADPTEVPADPTEVPADPTEVPAEPTEAPADPTEVPVDPTEAPAEPTEEPVVEETEAPTEAPTETPTEVPATAVPTEAPVAATEAPVAAPALQASLSGMSSYARIGGEDAQNIYFAVTASGGTAPYSVHVQITTGDNSASYDYTMAEGTQNFDILPPYWGFATYVAVSVVDAAGSSVDLGSHHVAVAKDEQEKESDWDKSVLYAADMTGDWGDDLVSIAITQLGYESSKVDFRYYNGGYQYYSRYAHAEGMSYHEWCTPFIAFCARYAGIDRDDIGFDGSVWMWIENVKAMGAYRDRSYIPQKGDIIFISFDDPDVATHIGIVYDGGQGYAYTIEGNVSSMVDKRLRVLYKEDAPENKGLEPEQMTDLPYHVVGYASIDALQEIYHQAAIDACKAEIDAFLTKHFGDTTGWTENEYGNAIMTKFQTNEAEFWAIEADYEALQNYIIAKGEAGDIVDADRDTVLGYNNFDKFIYVWDTIMSSYASVMPVAATSMLSGNLSINNDAGTLGTITDNSYYVSAEGGWFGREDVTLTFYNETDATMKLTFDYSLAGNYKTFTIDDVTAGTSGSFAGKVLEAGGSMTLFLAASESMGAGTAKLTLSNIALTEAASASNVTFDYDAALGSITVNGTTTAAGATLEVALTGAALVATPASGVTFLGWVDAEDGSILSTDTSYTLTPAEDMTVKIAFASATSDAYFKVSSNLFTDLNAAATYANSTTKLIISIADGILPAGSYTIPSDVTLLIPFDDANTLYTTAPSSDSSWNDNPAYVKPTAYRTLTMASGASITVDGAISLSAKHHSGAGGSITGGAPTGPCSFLQMNSGSSITVNSGASFYVWGFVTGSGAITAKSGAKVYENFQILGFRGGTATTDMAETNKSYGVFPINQYAVQNIEVPLTLEAGSTETSYTSIYMSKMNFGSDVAFISSSGAMFNLTSGSVTKQYKDGRLQVALDGVMDIATMSVSIGGTNMDTADFELPICGNITVTVKSGSKLNLKQDVALLPGAVINIESGAYCTLGSGYNMYLYDADQWGKYCFNSVATTAVGVAYTACGVASDTSGGDAKVVVNGTVDASAGSIYTTSGGANICSTGAGQITMTAGTQTETYQYEQGATEPYKAIAITSAQLKNGDGTYVETAKNSNANVTYTYTDGKWICETHAPGDAATCTTAQTCNACGYEIAPAAHTGLVVDPAVEATCTATGLTEGEHCTACGVTTITQTTIPMDDHTPGTAATCTTDQTCTVCSEVINPALEHSYTSEVTKEATCTETGVETFTCVNGCNDSYTEEIAATGHSYTSEVTKEATCTETGVETFTCVNGCGDTYTKTITKLNHTSGTEATCTTPQTCTVCGTQITAAKGHSWVEADCDTPKTCSVCGETEGEELGHTWVDADCDTPKTCSVCKTTEGTALGHTWVDATCTTPKTCSVCKTTEGEELGHTWENATCTTPKTCSVCKTTEGEKLGHTWVDADCDTPKTCSVCNATEGEELGHTWEDATCTAPKTCSVCGTTDGEVLGHSWVNATCTTAKTCSTCGTTEGTALGHTWEDATCTTAKTCSVCGTTDGEVLGHSWVDATCTAPKTCSVCGVTEGNAPGHNYTSEEIGATCTEDAYTEKTCSACGDVIKVTIPNTALGHSWVNATCTAPKTCSVCGATEGEKLDHTWVDADCDTPKTCSVCKTTEGEKLGHKHDAVVTAPTCTEKGYTTYTCSVCGDTYTADETAATGHSYDKVVTEPTCTEKGYTTYTCSVCGDTYTADETAATGHSYNKVVTDPTCTTKGYTTYTCSVCGDTYTADETAMISHSYNAVVTEPTCTVAGYTTHTCSVCGNSYKEAGDAALGHDIVIDQAVAATCTEKGKTEGSHCSRCDDATVAQKDVTALGHSYGDAVVTPPTCTVDGYSTYTCLRGCGDSYTDDVVTASGHTWVDADCDTPKTCSVCGATEGEATGHSWQDATCTAPKTCSACGATEGEANGHNHQAVVTDPTCTEGGYTTYTCSDCGDTYKADETAATGHNHQAVVTEPTCTEGGYTTYTCSDCGDTYKADETEATGHDWQLVNTTTAPSCTETGVGDYACANCDATNTGVIIEALGHDMVDQDRVEPTCTEPGSYAGSKCSRCDYTVGSGVIPANGHTWEAGEVTTPATCTENGEMTYTCTVEECGETKTEVITAPGHNYSKVVTPVTCTTNGYTTHTCSVCGDSYVDNVVAAEGHQYDAVVIAPTCTADGYTTYTCSACGDSYVDNEVATEGHQYDAVVIDPTCTADGYTTYTCSVCGNSYVDDEVATEGHQYDKVVTAPTCTEQGYTTYTCTVCGHSYVADKVANTGHNTVTAPAVAATCTTDGKTEGSYCSVCGTVFEAQEIITAPGHKYDEVVTDPTCTEDGYTTYTCSACGDSYVDDEVATEGHQYDAVVIDPTCTEQGYTTYTCKVCGHSYVDDEVATEGHKYDEVVTAPTCTADGYTTYTCSVCGDSYVDDSVAMLGHDYEEKVTKEATCTEDGVKTYTCKNNASHTYEVAIPSPGHSEEEIPAVESTCSKTGLSAGVKCSVCGTVLEEQQETAKKAHTIVTVDAVTATCTQPGLTEGKKCSVCNEVLLEQTTVDALGHSWDSGVVTKVATCADEGETLHYCTKGCTNEDGTPISETREVEKNTKNHVWDEGKVVTEATCVAQGLKVYTCKTGCLDTNGAVATKNENIPVDTTKHVWDAGKTTLAPTCSATGIKTYTCTACKNADGSDVTKTEVLDIVAENHIWDAGEITVEPTCSATGTKTYTCTLCKNADGTATTKEETLAIDPANHEWDDGEVTLEATCTTTGLKVYTCLACKNADGSAVTKTEKLEINAENHVWSKGEVTLAPTCSATGTKTYTCTACKNADGSDVTKTEVLDIVAENHAWDVGEITLKPTCAATGIKTYTCTLCKNADGTATTKEETLVIDPTNHEWDKGEVTLAPTCSATGVMTYTCLGCKNADGSDVTLKEELAIVPENHVWNAGEVTLEPTCSATGIKTYTCTVCKQEDGSATTKTEEIAINPDNHVWDTGKVVLEPTCSATGTMTYTCTACKQADGSAVTKDEELAIDPDNHNWDEGNITVEPTCATVGVKTYTCTLCKNEDGSAVTMEEEVAIDPTNHAWDEGQVTKEATCVAEGEMTFICTNPDCVDENGVAPTKTEVIAIDPDNHAYDTENGVVITEATCMTEGEMTVTCIRQQLDENGEPMVDENGEAVICGHQTNVTIEIDPENHLWSEEGVEEPVHSCTQEGTLTYVCLNTKVVVGEDGTETTENCAVVKTETVPMHDAQPIGEAKAATCTEDGVTEGSYCPTCDTVLEEQAVIPATGHNWNGVYPCCNENSACINEGCDVVYTAQQEHDMLAATCVDPATCAFGCGYTDGEALGHTVVIDEAVAATCTSTGLTEGEHCSVCNEVLKEQEEVPMTEHNWVTTDIEVEARCDQTGHKIGSTYCADCDYSEDASSITPAPGHTWTLVSAKKPTYTSVGWNEHHACSVCGAKFTEEGHAEYIAYEEIPVLPAQDIETYEQFMANLIWLEQMAEAYAMENPGTDAMMLVIKYIRTGVDRYNSGSWGIMAGYENAGFAKFALEMEDMVNTSLVESGEDMDLVNVSGMKNIHNFTLPNGDTVDFGHMFGTMDITYHNNGSQNHADVGGWAGDIVDMLSTTDEFGVGESVTFEEKVAYITNNYLNKDTPKDEEGAFSLTDMYGDLDAYYIMQNLNGSSYSAGDMTALFESYFTASLNDVQRADYLLSNRLGGVSTRADVRTAVYNAYTGNKMIATLEGTREFNYSGDALAELRKACCYTFADYICKLAGDYVEDLGNIYYTVFDSETSTLAPGITQQINYATTADGKQIAYYIATGDLRRDDVHVYANYYSRTPGTPENPEWAMARVLDQANAAQERYGNPESEEYIENFEAIVAINAGGYDMSNGDPGGLLLMDGIQYKACGSGGFFAILSDGTARLGTTAEWNANYAGTDLVKEAIGGFGTVLVKDGQVAITATSDYYTSRAPRSAVGITATGKVVFMVLDGRQEPFSCGGSMLEIAHIMKEAGCINAINLDGGGSSTFVARQVGDEELTVINRPSDGAPRSVSTSLLMSSTAPSSTTFDHAALETAYDYATIGTSVQVTATGISPSGNVVDLPEGTTWALDVDENWATITEDGVVTGKRLCSVEVRLMLGEEIVGTKTITITNPDQVYFTKDKIDVVYGAAVELPVKANFEGKAVAINSGDVTFTLSSPTAGEMQGMFFHAAADSGIRALTITAALVANSSATDSISVALYAQGENSFDFDQATGGDRMLAWDRQVSNSTEEDGNIYNVIDPEQDMVTSYIIALDMTAIPIPERLAELTYMLPGADMEGASAWTFLLQLAERISDLTWVKAQITFDERFDVDVSEIKLINDYFTLNNVELDEETNNMVLTLGWIKQSAAIDAATANPLCIVNGIKLTPKEGTWDETTKITATHEGDISYRIYMRASGLYSFAQKAENQATFGLYPYKHPVNTSEAGGYFEDTYATFEDSYTLINALKEGWYNEDGGFAYYVAGQRLTGINEVEGYYYDFGTEGINVGQTKLTALFYDEEAGVYRYAKDGLLQNGWQSISGEWYYFENYAAVSGDKTVGIVDYTFEENGRMAHGVWYQTSEGFRYYNGPTYIEKNWALIDGEWYCFKNGYRLTGYQFVGSQSEIYQDVKWRYFDENGVYIMTLGTGIFEMNGNYHYLEDGVGQEKYLMEYEGNYYFAKYQGKLVTNETMYAWATNCDMPKGTYTFDEYGRMILNGIIDVDGVLYYYEDGERVEKGLVYVNNDYYFAGSGGKVYVDQEFYAYMTSCDLDVGFYEAGSDGKLILNGIYYKSSHPYYFENSLGVEKGLFYYEGNYYFAQWNGKLVTSAVQYAYLVNCDLPKAQYEFGADGKMLDGIVDVDGVLYYYKLGKRTEAGLVYVGEDYYFAEYGGKVSVDKTFYAYMTSCDLDKDFYEAGSDGKLILNGIYYKSGHPYYFENSRGMEKGLFYYEGNYYFSQWKGKLIVSAVQYAYLVSCDLPKTQYEFDAEGKMMQGIYEIDGVLYYYELGKRTEAGLVYVGEDYYFAEYNGKVCVNKSFYAYMTSCDLPMGRYEAGSDGKLILNGIYYKSGHPYYFENSRGAEKGLFYLDGSYYFSKWQGKLVVNERIYAYMTSCDLPVGHYEFGADGRMIIDGIVEKDGVLYYYEGGKGVEAGLVCVDGDYYFAAYQGKLYVSQTFYAYMTSCDLPVGHYECGADGKINVENLPDTSLSGIVEVDGVLYYYEKGQGVEAGLVCVDGEYYFAAYQGKLYTSQDRFYAYMTSCDLPVGFYACGADGKIILDTAAE